MPQAPEPIPTTGDAYAGGYSYTIDGAPLRASMLSPDQFGLWENSAATPIGSNTETGSSL